MRLLFVNEKIGQYGGTEQYLNQILPVLKGKGFEVGMAYESGDTSFFDNLGIPSFQIANLSDFSPQEINRVEADIERLVTSYNPDLVNLHNLRNPFAIKKFIHLKPTVWFCHDHYFTCLKNPPSRFSRFFNRSEAFPADWCCAVLGVLDRELSLNPIELYRKIRNKRFEQKSFKGVKKILVISQYMKKSLVDCGFDETLINIVPRQVRDLPVSFDYQSRGIDILFVGRLEQEKGSRIILESTKYIKTKDWHLRIVGKGTDFKWCQNFVEQNRLGACVELLGLQCEKDVSTFIEQSDLVVFPSIWPEPFGVVGIEAMAYGRPVVAFDVGGVSEWLKDGINGLFARLNDAKDLAAKIDTLLGNRNKSKELGLKGRQMVEDKFTLEKHLEILTKIYEQILKK